MSSSGETPFGTDTTPEIIVKIIGSKLVRYYVEKPKKILEQAVKTETGSIKPPLDSGSQIQKRLRTSPCNATSRPGGQCYGKDTDKDEERSFEMGKNNSQSKGNEEKIHTKEKISFKGNASKPLDVQCITAPTGDQSLSYIHGPRKPFQRSQALQSYTTSGDHKNDHQTGIPSTRTRNAPSVDGPLLTIVRSELKSDSLSELEKVKVELQSLDPDLSGFIHQSQMSLVFLRHELPLQLPTVRLLFDKFSEPTNPELVNYEELLHFLMTAASFEDHNAAHLTYSPPTKTDNEKESYCDEDAKFLQLLAEAIKDCNGAVDLRRLRLSFQDTDRMDTGLLPKHEVKAICQKHLPSIPPLLLEGLVNKTWYQRSMVQWKKLVELLDRSLSFKHTNVPSVTRKLEFTTKPVEPLAPAPIMSLRIHIKKKENKIAYISFTKASRACKDSSFLLESSPVIQPFHGKSKSSSFKESETWLERFNRLEKALRMCDSKNTGILEKDKARRLIHNYNLIFDLCLSPLKIDQGFHSFQHGGNIKLEPILQYLKEL
uniref:Chromosome 1 open reading frame 87 n=1 Tax=Latimeria chalumnae TaxID=7897 RepID=H3AWV4_LATCH